jgi:D-arabinose 5-phosphate isomerase GutQ
VEAVPGPGHDGHVGKVVAHQLRGLELVIHIIHRQHQYPSVFQPGIS